MMEAMEPPSKVPSDRAFRADLRMGVQVPWVARTEMPVRPGGRAALHISHTRKWNTELTAEEAKAQSGREQGLLGHSVWGSWTSTQDS